MISILRDEQIKTKRKIKIKDKAEDQVPEKRRRQKPGLDVKRYSAARRNSVSNLCRARVPTRMSVNRPRPNQKPRKRLPLGLSPPRKLASAIKSTIPSHATPGRM